VNEGHTSRHKGSMQDVDVPDAEIKGNIRGAAPFRRLLKEDREVILIPQRDSLTLGDLELDLQADAPGIPIAGPRPTRNR
jgi:hypothetical protein